MNYKLGTHNSMSYLSPLKWWHKPFHFMSRCQRVSIQEQYEEYNARYFDLRITLYKGEWRLTFIGGYTKADWSTLFTSVIPKPIYIYEAVSSTTGNILDDWCPFFYAKRYNKDNYAQGTAKDFLVLDFIDIKE